MRSTKVLYSELTPSEFRLRLAKAPIAYLPLGTLEWHGEHLPLGSDGLQSQGFFKLLAQRVGGIVLPMLFLGPDLHQEINGKDYYGMDMVGFPKGFPQQLDGSAYWVEDDVFHCLLETILTGLKRAGFKIVVAHGHGPSTKAFKYGIPEWSQKLDLKLFYCWEDVSNDPSSGLQTDHAAANETSIMMALHPNLVEMENLPSDLAQWPLAILGQDPRLFASPEAGWQILSKTLDWMERVLRQELEGFAA